MTDERSLRELQERVGMDHEPGRAMIPPDYGSLTVHGVKLVGDGDGAYIDMDVMPSETLGLLLLRRAGLDRLGTQFSANDQAILDSSVPKSWVLSGKALDSVLDDFIALAGGDNEKYAAFAAKFGYLGLCNKHALPVKHLPFEKPTDLLFDMVNPQVEPCGIEGIERLKDLRWYVSWVKGMLELTCRLRENNEYPNKVPNFGTQDQWQALDADASRLGVCMIPPKNQEDAELFLECYLDYGRAWGEVELINRWNGGRLVAGYQCISLWDHIIKRLMFRLAGVARLCQGCFKAMEPRAKEWCVTCRPLYAASTRQRRTRTKEARRKAALTDH